MYSFVGYIGNLKLVCSIYTYITSCNKFLIKVQNVVFGQNNIMYVYSDILAIFLSTIYRNLINMLLLNKCKILKKIQLQYYVL